MPAFTDTSRDDLERPLLETLRALKDSTLSQRCHHARHTRAVLARLIDALADRPAAESVWHDARFAHPGWRTPLRRRLVNAWGAWAMQTQEWLDELDIPPLDKARLKLAARQLLDASAPSNSPFNPALTQRLKQTGGRCLRDGIAHLREDIATGQPVPAAHAPGSFLVGRDLASTPGHIVHRTPMFELIQYQPLTATVYQVPLLVIPPPLNRYYLLDLEPDCSLVRYALNQGLQVFLISWRNPNPSHATWGLNDYVGAAAAALDATCDIASSGASVLGVCSGGVIGLGLQGLLHAQGREDRVKSASYLATPLHFRQHSELSLLASPAMRQHVRNRAWRQGCISHRQLAAAFAWLRPGQLVWPHMQRYILAQTEQPDPLTFWSQDSTRLPAQMVHDLLDLLERDALITPGALKLKGFTVELHKLRTPSWHLGAERDHIVPWQNAYPGDSLGGDKTFTLSHGGHIQSLVNPPHHPSAWFRSAPVIAGESVTQWHTGSEQQSGSWWPLWGEWLKSYSGTLRQAPATAGNADYSAQYPAPGRYVHQL